MPQDDTWEPNRHHRKITPLSHNHLTRTTSAMPPSLANTVAQAEHDRRDSHLPVVSHTEDAELLKQQTQAVTDRIPPKGCRHPLVKPWANGTEMGNTCQLCGAIVNTGTSKLIQRRLMTAKMTTHSNRKVCGGTELDPVQDEIDEANRLQEEAHLEVQTSSQEQSDRSSMPSGRGDGRKGQDPKPDGSESGVSRSMKTGPHWVGSQRQKKMWKMV